MKTFLTSTEVGMSHMMSTKDNLDLKKTWQEHQKSLRQNEH